MGIVNILYTCSINLDCIAKIAKVCINYFYYVNNLLVRLIDSVCYLLARLRIYAQMYTCTFVHVGLFKAGLTY